jgi:hypothetical protein
MDVPVIFREARGGIAEFSEAATTSHVGRYAIPGKSPMMSRRLIGLCGAFTAEFMRPDA